MTDLRALAGGVICCGFAGTGLDSGLERKLSNLRLAGVVLFARNTETVEQTRALTDRVRTLLEWPIIAIDQEGGRVMRLRNGVRAIPSMREVGESNDLAAAERIATQLGSDLRRAGVNVDFAPVLDLALYDSNTVIGDRSFGSDPRKVAQFGRAFAQGLDLAGIVPTFKHFPGHGSTDVDSHFDLPAIDVDLGTLYRRDLIPFAELLPQAQAVMTAHIIVRALDPERPATLSKRVLSGLLREEIGFKGVCFTDCMEMDAIAKHAGSVQGAVDAIRAGADCVLISHRLDLAEQVAGALEQAVTSGTLEIDRLEEAHDRVRSLRTALC